MAPIILVLLILSFIVKNFSTLLVLLLPIYGMILLWKHSELRNLNTTEKKLASLFLYIFIIGIFSWLISDYQADPGYVANNYQYLLAIALIFVFKYVDVNEKILTNLFIFIAIWFGVFAYSEFIINSGEERVGIAYGIGNFSVMTLIISVIVTDMVIRNKIIMKKGVPVLILIIGAMVLSGSRAVLLFYLSSLVVLLVLYGGNIRKRVYPVFIAFLVVSIVSMVYPNSIIYKRFLLVSENISDYIHSSPDSTKKDSSIGQRFEGWKSGVILYSENPVLGVGLGSYKDGVKELVKEDKLNPAVLKLSHAHNEYLQIMSEQGALGLLGLLVLYGGLLVFYVKRRNSYNAEISNMSFLGIDLLLAYIFLGITGAPMTQNISTSIFLIFNIIFIENILRREKVLQEMS